MSENAEFPEIEKMNDPSTNDMVSIARDFLSWLEEQGLRIGRVDSVGMFLPPSDSERPEELAHRYAGVNYRQLNRERAQLLGRIQNNIQRLGG